MIFLLDCNFLNENLRRLNVFLLCFLKLKSPKEIPWAFVFNNLTLY